MSVSIYSNSLTEFIRCIVLILLCVILPRDHRHPVGSTLTLCCHFELKSVLVSEITGLALGIGVQQNTEQTRDEQMCRQSER